MNKKKELITSNNKLLTLYKLQYFDFLILLFLSLAIIGTNLVGVYSREFIADYCITFEGGYRIYKGQVPYIDFYIPVGPVVFYIQAFFNFIFGPNVLASGMHSSITAIILSGYCYFVLRQNFNRIISSLLSYSLFISYCGYISLPWYTTEAFFFLLLNLLIFIDERNQIFNFKLLVASVIFCIFSFFSKQDVGILHFLFLTGYIYIFSANNLSKKLWHTFLFMVSFLFLTIFIMNIFNQDGNFFYWFNLGQYPHSSRLEGITNIENLRYITRASVLSIALFGIYLWFTNNSPTIRKLVFILISINVISFLVSLTSHTTDQSLNEATTLTVIILLKIFLKDITWLIKEKSSILCMIIFSFCLILHQNFLTLMLLGRNISQRLITNNIIQEGAYKGIPMSREALEDLKTIRSLIDKKRTFLNTSEYGFLYADYNMDPPKQVPLWFHFGVSIFERDLLSLKRYISINQPNVILLQEAHCDSPESKFETNLLEHLLVIGYRKIFSAKPPAHYRRDIKVLVR